MKEIGKHVFCVNLKDNGGEAFIITTTIFDNGDGDIFYNQSLSLGSYGNSAELNLTSAILTPQKLRDMASELERTIWEAKKNDHT